MWVASCRFLFWYKLIKIKIMCLYPKLIRNRRFLRNKRNQGNPPVCKDERMAYVSVGCGRCSQCLKRKASDWAIRLQIECKLNPIRCHFVTLTFNEDSYVKYCKSVNYEDRYARDNEVCRMAVRHMFDRWRKAEGSIPKHWLITELGGGHSKRIHLHGFIWTEDIKSLAKIWANGYTYTGSYMSNSAISYCVKYVYKTNEGAEGFVPKVLTSAGIGSGWLASQGSNYAKFRGQDTEAVIRDNRGYKLPMPSYIKRKIYTEKQRELLWLNELNKEVLYIGSETIKFKDWPNLEALIDYIKRRLGEEQVSDVKRGFKGVEGYEERITDSIRAYKVWLDLWTAEDLRDAEEAASRIELDSEPNREWSLKDRFSVPF